MCFVDKSVGDVDDGVENSLGLPSIFFVKEWGFNWHFKKRVSSASSA